MVQGIREAGTASSHVDVPQNSRREAGKGWDFGHPKAQPARRMAVHGVTVVHRVRLQYFARIVGHIHTAVLAGSRRDQTLEYSWRASNRRAAANPRAVLALSLMNNSEWVGVDAGCCAA